MSDGQTVTTEVESDDTYTKAEQQHYADILAGAREVQRLKDLADRAKEKYKAAKAKYDEAVEEHRAMELRGPDQQPKLPGLEDMDHPAEDWRVVPLSGLALSVKVFKALTAAGMSTIGDVNEWQSGNIDAPLTDIPGIGQKGAEEIEERLTQFWQEHPELADPDKREEEEEDAAGR